MGEEKAKSLTNKLSIKKIVFNVLVVSLTILILGFAINIKYAVGYLFILIIHELGHYATAKFLKVNVAFGGFTPVGAYIIHEDTESCKENALVAIGGPLFGGALGVIYYILYYITKDNTFLVLSFTSIILNLGNLIPVKPLDGGQIVEAISPIICYIGFPFLVYLLISTNKLKSRILLLLLILVGGYQTYQLSIKYKTDSYYKIDKQSKIKFAIAYGILVSFLAISAIYLYNTVNYGEVFKSIARVK